VPIPLGHGDPLRWEGDGGRGRGVMGEGGWGLCCYFECQRDTEAKMAEEVPY